MKIYVDSQIRIENPSEEVIQYCKSFLTLKNPEIQKKELWDFTLETYHQ